MKVCLFTPVFLPTVGGVGIVVHQIASYLTELGHPVTVVTHKHRGEIYRLDVPYRVYRHRRPFSIKFGVHQMILYLIREKMMKGFDILHCHSAYPHGYIGASFKKIFRTPLIITSHGDIIKDGGIRKSARLSRRTKKAMELADAVTAVSRYMKEQSIDAGASEKKIYYIPNGVDLREFRSEEKFVFDEPYLFSMGIFRKVKGFDVLIRAFKDVKRVHPEVSLFIAGIGKEKDGLKKLTEDLNLGGSIHFLGFLSVQEKIKLLKGCELYICSAIREEPFSNSTLEAFAAGKTVVASNLGGIPDVVNDGLNGLLVPPGNPDLLSKKIIGLLNQPALIKRLSTNARIKSEEFDLAITMNRYLRLYEKLLNQ
jgi:glycosyltransferase involved in cell wall biosynthesis